MKIYGQSDELIVRKMTKNDLVSFLAIMEEHGTKEDFTVEDIRNLWKFRNQKGDLQCTVTSIDGNVIYGFCGVLRLKTDNPKIYINFFSEYYSSVYKEQTKVIMEHSI